MTSSTFGLIDVVCARGKKRVEPITGLTLFDVHAFGAH